MRSRRCKNIIINDESDFKIGDVVFYATDRGVFGVEVLKNKSDIKIQVNWNGPFLIN